MEVSAFGGFLGKRGTGAGSDFTRIRSLRSSYNTVAFLYNHCPAPDNRNTASKHTSAAETLREPRLLGVQQSGTEHSG